MRVSSKNFQRFLRKHGWVTVNQPNQNTVYLESPRDQDGDWSSVMLPVDMSLADAERRVIEALGVVAEAFGMPKRVLAISIERWDMDIINSRLNSKRESIASIPLSLATIVIDNLRSFLGYAAYTQITPKKFFPRAGKAASEFVASCNFGHTYEGSFGMTIECPLSSLRQLAISEDLVDAPFERQVTIRIAEGYRQLQEAKKTGNPNILIDGYTTGMNANMLRALVDIYENVAPALEIEYSVNWATELTPPATYADTPRLQFDGLAHEISRYAADALEREDEEQQAQIVSYVVSLTSEMPLSEGIQDEFDHVITLDWEREKGARVRVRVALPAGEYKKACDAHKNGKKIIVSGFPEKEGKFWFLSRPSEITYAT